MKLWINPVGFDHAKQLQNNNHIDYLIVGVKKYSTRNTCILDIDQIKQLDLNKVAVSINNLYMDDEINGLTNCIKQLKTIGVKTIIFSDYGVKQICDELKYAPYFVYNSETLTTNYGQLPFFKKNNIKEVVLPRELNLNEIKKFAYYKQGVKLQMQAEGYGLVMHSKWSLLTNFKKQFNIKQDLSNKLFYLKEELRDLPNLIYEDETGSHMFTGYNVSILEYLKQLMEAGIDSIYFMSFLHDKKWVDQTLNIYIKAIDLIQGKKANDKAIALLADEIKKLNKINACGFIDPTKGLLHLIKEEENE